MKRSTELTKDDVRIPPRVECRDISLSEQLISRFKYCSLKLDGHWTAVYKDRYGVVSVWTRNNINITAKVSHNLWYNSIAVYFPGNIWIIGELWHSNMPCSSISTALANKENLSFYAHSLDFVSEFEAAEEFCTSRNIGFVPYVSSEDQEFTKSWCENFYELQQKFYSPADGLVFCDGSGLNLRRWKPDKTIDLIYSGCDRGKGKYKFTAGRIRLVTEEGYPVAKASGMSDAERDYIFNNDERLKGKVVEVRYKSITAHGKLRHPSFIRFRDDKSRGECTVHQDKELEEYYARRRRDHSQTV